MKKIKMFIVFGLVLSTLTLFAFPAMANASSKRPSLPDGGKASVRMKWFFAGTMTGWFAGIQEGIYKKYGIDLTINPGGPDNNSVKLVASGSDLFGVAGADELLLARAKGMPVVAIGVLFKESPICFIAKKSKKITSPKDWAGKTVEVSYGSNAETQFRALASMFNVKNIKEVPYTFNLIPFIEGKVDASVAYKMDQVVTLKRRGVDLSIIEIKDYGINPYGDVIIAHENTLKNYPELVAAFMQATIESQKMAIESPEKAIKALIAANKGQLKEDNELAVWQATIPFLLADGGIGELCEMKKARWGETWNMLKKYNKLKGDISLSDAYTNNYK